MNITVQILGTAVSVGAVIVAGALWAFRAVVAKDVSPIIIELRSEAKALTREFQAFREVKEEERRETRQILKDLDAIVRDHELRLTVIEQPTPPATSARKRRAA